jgi:DNA-binding LacI/PurR family transcriptional regulator
MNSQIVSNLKINLNQYGRNDTVDVIHAALSDKLRDVEMSGMRLASVRYLAQELGVARQTMQKVFVKLEAEGVIAKIPGKRIWNVNPTRKWRPRCIGMILPIPFSEYFMPGTEYGQRHFRMYSGIVDRAAESGFSLIPVFLPQPDAPEEQIEAFMRQLKQQCCAVIHFGDRGYVSDPPLMKLLQEEDLAQISFTCEFSAFNVGAVTFDPDYAARMAISYLRENGHRNICLVYNTYNQNEKTAGNYILTEQDDMLKKFRKAGAVPDNLSFLPVTQKDTGGSLEKELKKILGQENMPTAFWCRNDSLAIELMAILKQQGHKIPDDFSVIGFNNLSESASCDPPLSTFNNPFYEMGQVVINRLNEYMQDGVTPENRITRLQPMLIARASVGIWKSKFFDH